MEPNKMKQKRWKYLYAAAALGMTFLLNLSGCSRRFTNYPETAGTVAIVDSTEREAVRDENGENPDQPIDLDNLGEQQSAAEMEALAAAEAAEPETAEEILETASVSGRGRASAFSVCGYLAEPLLRYEDEGRRGDRGRRRS